MIAKLAVVVVILLDVGTKSKDLPELWVELGNLAAWNKSIPPVILMLNS